MTEWLFLVAVFAAALASPGPDFIMMTRLSLTQGRFKAILAALGLGLGVCVHVTYVAAGLGALIASSTLWFTALKIMGAAYLFYIGWQGLRSKAQNATGEQAVPLKVLSAKGAVWQGFLTNVLNPKATLFFVALFSQFLKADGGLGQMVVYGGTCVIMTFLWFTIVATCLTTPAVKTRFVRVSHWLDRVCGGLFIALGVRLILTKAPH